jgi:hypothetical protein
MLQTTPTITTIEATTARDRRIAPALLIGGTFLLTTVANFLFNAASAIWDLQESFGAGGLSRADQLPVIAGLGILGLVVALVLGNVFKGEKAARGAIVLGTLSILTLPTFFSGAPAVLGAVAAVRAGFAKGGQPTTGAARGFGIAGIVVAVLVIVAVFGGNLAGIIDHAA